MNNNKEQFNFGVRTPQHLIFQTIGEFFSQPNLNVYERFFQVEENDIVLDIGASLGAFTYTILNKNPKHCYVVEPISYFFKILKQNLEGSAVTFIRAAISDTSTVVPITFDNITDNVRGLDFRELVNEMCLDKIDFLKIDCEGGEYNILKESNLDILLNIPKIAGEFHLGDRREDFRYVRDVMLPHFKHFEIYSVDGVDIKWDLYNEHFLDYYNEVNFYLFNTNPNPF